MPAADVLEAATELPDPDAPEADDPFDAEAPCELEPPFDAEEEPTLDACDEPASSDGGAAPLLQAKERIEASDTSEAEGRA